MRFIFIPFIFFFHIFIASGQQPVFEWVTECGNPPNTTDAKTDLAPDNMGGFYFAGEFVEMAEFGAKTILSSGGTDVFLVKLDADGSILFANRLGGVDEDYLRRIKADDAGNLLVLGYFYGTTQIGNDTYTSFGSQDIFVAKYDSEGEFLWSFRAGGMMTDYASDLVIDHANNIIITGHFLDTIRFGLLTIPYTLCCGSREIFIVNYTAAGDILWGEQITGTYSSVHSIAMNDDGNMVLSGWFTGDVLFGPLSLSNPSGYHNYITGLPVRIMT